MGLVPEWAQRARSTWRYRGQGRPPFAVEPGPGQESVWDYPRPPRLEVDVREVIVRVGAHEIARSRRTIRLLETASPRRSTCHRMMCAESASRSDRRARDASGRVWRLTGP